VRTAPSILLLIVILIPQTGQPRSQIADRISLEIGTITVWLGMPKAELRQKFSDAGYEISDMGDDSVAAIGKGRKEPPHLFDFKNGLLVYASVDWYMSGADEMDAVIGALGALAEKSKIPCLLEHSPLLQPSLHADRIFITCGHRTVLIANGKMENEPFVEVSEYIGEPLTGIQK
jgi:hypothetical protein